MSPRRARLVSLLLNALLLVVLVERIAAAASIALQKPSTLRFGQVDFNVYYASAALLARGLDPYDGSLIREFLERRGLAYIEGSNYIYPPFLAALLAPVSSVDPHLLGFLWTLGSLAALGLALWLILRGMDLSGPAARSWWKGALIFACLFSPVRHSLYVGQVNAFLLLFIAAAFWSLRQGRERLSGILVALAALIKIAPSLLALHLLAARRFRGLQALLLTVVLLGGATALFLRDEWISFIATVPVRLATPMAHPVNQSLNGFLSRLLTLNPFTIPLWDAGPDLVLTLASAGGLGIVAGVALVLIRCGPDLLREQAGLSFGALTVASLLVSPFAWENLYLLCLFPLLVLALRWASLGQGARIAVVASAVLIEAQRLWDPFTNAPQDHAGLRHFGLGMSLGFYGGILLLCVLLRETAKPPSPR